MFDGLASRLKTEVSALAPASASAKIRIIASPERSYSDWLGGSMLSTLSNFSSMWVTAKEY